MTTPTSDEELKTALHRLIIENRNEAGDIAKDEQLAMANEIMHLIQADRLRWLETVLPNNYPEVGVTQNQIDFARGYNVALADIRRKGGL